MNDLSAVNPAGPTPKISLKIEKPRDQSIHGFFNTLLIISFLLIAATLWVLALEYLDMPAPMWLLDLIDELKLIFA